jgi:hypothetical protein
VSLDSEVLVAMQAHVAARMSNDADAALNSYSDDWRDSKGYTKQTLTDWHLASIIGSAKLEITIDLRTVEITVDGSKPALVQSALILRKAEFLISIVYKRNLTEFGA